MSAAEKFDYILCTRKNGTKFIKAVHYSCEFDGWVEDYCKWYGVKDVRLTDDGDVCLVWVSND